MDSHGVSERRACLVLQLHRSVKRYQPCERNDDALKDRLNVLAQKYPRYGYLLLHGLLKQEGLVQVPLS
jgi:putative transposase